MNDVIYRVVMMTTNNLNDLELATLNNCAQMDIDPRKRLGSEKYLHLFDSVDAAGVPHMHDETKEALAAIVNWRFA